MFCDRHQQLRLNITECRRFLYFHLMSVHLGVDKISGVVDTIESKVDNRRQPPLNPTQSIVFVVP